MQKSMRMRARRRGLALLAALVGGLAAGAAVADDTNGAGAASGQTTENGVVVIRGSEIGGAFPSEEAAREPTPVLVGFPFEWRQAAYRPKVAPPCYLTTSVTDESVWGGTSRRGLLRSNYCPWY